MTKLEQQKDNYFYSNNNDDDDNDDTLKECNSYSDDYWLDTSVPPPSPPPPPCANRVRIIKHLKKPVLSLQERFEQQLEKGQLPKEERIENDRPTENGDDDVFIIHHLKDDAHACSIMFDQDSIFDTRLSVPSVSCKTSLSDDDPSDIISTSTSTSTIARKQSAKQKRSKNKKRSGKKRSHKKKEQQCQSEKKIAIKKDTLLCDEACSRLQNRLLDQQQPSSVEEKWTDPGRLRPRNKTNASEQRTSLLPLRNNNIKITTATTKNHSTRAIS